MIYTIMVMFLGRNLISKLDYKGVKAQKHSRYVGDVDEFTLEGVVIDNFLFGVTAVGENGYESVVA